LNIFCPPRPLGAADLFLAGHLRQICALFQQFCVLTYGKAARYISNSACYLSNYAL
jgi:hypothetical protein